MVKCVACEKEHNKKDVLYTEDRQPYCVNPFSCTDEHPNSTKNILARQGAVDMYTEADLEKAIFNNLNVPQDVKERIIKIASKPQSIRLSKPDIAYYLLTLQETRGLSSISEAVRYCVHLAMRMEPIGDIEAPEEMDIESSEDTPEFHGQSEESIIPDMPKSINVNWDEVPAKTEEPVEKLETEDKFVF